MTFGTILCWGGCPVYCRVLASIPGVYLGDTNNDPLQVRQSKTPQEIVKCPLVENH